VVVIEFEILAFFAIMSLPLSTEQLEQLLPDTKEILLQYFGDQNTRLDDMRSKYERLRVDSGMSRSVMNVANIGEARNLPAGRS